MKQKMASLVVVTVLLLVGCSSSAPNLASSVEDIEGTWEGTEGIADAYQFNKDRTWRSALSPDGLVDPFNQGDFWFEETNFFISYSAGFGLTRCGETVGSYEIELLDTGNISFTVVEDECQTRVDNLQGRIEDGDEIEWAPFP